MGDCFIKFSKLWSLSRLRYSNQGSERGEGLNLAPYPGYPEHWDRIEDEEFPILDLEDLEADDLGNQTSWDSLVSGLGLGLGEITEIKLNPELCNIIFNRMFILWLNYLTLLCNLYVYKAERVKINYMYSLILFILCCFIVV